MDKYRCAVKTLLLALGQCFLFLYQQLFKFIENALKLDIPYPVKLGTCFYIPIELTWDFIHNTQIVLHSDDGKSFSSSDAVIKPFSATHRRMYDRMQEVPCLLPIEIRNYMTDFQIAVDTGKQTVLSKQLYLVGEPCAAHDYGCKRIFMSRYYKVVYKEGMQRYAGFLSWLLDGHLKSRLVQLQCMQFGYTIQVLGCNLYKLMEEVPAETAETEVAMEALANKPSAIKILLYVYGRRLGDW